MPFDLLIRNGLLVDGTGRPPVRADVAISGSRIAAVGEGLGDGGSASHASHVTRVIDAEGCIVTPGFVDLHTHYDGQISWDPELTPSSLHGVTTAVLGSCGVGFAPVHVEDRNTLIELMESVEDIPGSALAEGLRWSWSSFPEYMRAVDYPHAIDFALQVPHDALRVYVMRERGVRGEVATADDIARMRALLREALEAGAVGFTTGRTDNHRSKHGGATPAAESSVAELEGLARAFEGLPHGVIQAVSDFDMASGEERFDPEFDVLERMAAASGGHPLSISCMQRDLAPQQWRRILARVEAATMRGVPMRVQAGARGIGVLLGLETTFHPFMGFPSYKEIASLPLAARVAKMREPLFKARILSETSDKVAGDGSPIPPLADVMLSKLETLSMRLFRLGERPDYEPAIERSIYAEAYARGVKALEAIYDAMLENDGHELLYFPIFNYTEFSLDNVRTMLTHPCALPGLSDGGAHVGTVCDASFPTFMLAHWTRDRAHGRLPLERVVKMMSHDVASYVGLRDRGLVAPGMRADLNVIDHAGLRLHRPGLVHDLPAGGRRLIQRASGYRATVVAGEIILRDDVLTGARPGRLARPS
jgi:N-acyl-D-aspartate/D-glutamate deacylase